MKDMIKLADYKADDIYDIFQLTDEVRQGKYQDF